MKALYTLATTAALACAPVLAQTSGQHAHGNGGSNDMMQSMHESMKDMQSMHMSGDTDKDFAQMMRMHHQHGIQMAEAELKNGNDPKMKEMARKIVDSQRRETKEFDEWLSNKK